MKSHEHNQFNYQQGVKKKSVRAFRISLRLFDC